MIQHAGLFPHRTIVDNVATVPMLLGANRREARVKALELLERVGLPASFAKRYPAQLSGGQQQRVGVARALAADPPVMLMDEPFSAVDPVVREQLQNEFLRLQSELGKTIVFVTHDIDEAIKLGDQVAVLRVGGQLAQLATPAELLSNPVDDFVAGFVGRDRGYRALGFEPVSGLQLDPEDTVLIGSPVADAAAVSRDGWVLVVDDLQSPQGWLELDNDAARASTAVTPPAASSRRHGGGARRHVPRDPRRRAVVTDRPRRDCRRARGGFAGTITAAAVVQLLEKQSRPSRCGNDGCGGAAASGAELVVPLAFLGLLHRASTPRPGLALGSRLAFRTARR